jgi:threonine dehydrogenase-like Zn-dependent dehydrogenase
MIAHRSQLYAVPEALTNDRAVLVEPLACAVHTALRARIEPGQSVLVSGAGAVGLFATLAIRELTQAGRITVVAKHPKQRELARAFGASDVVAPDEVFRGVRRATGAFRLKPEMAKEFLLGGVDVAVDAVGSKDSIDTVLRVTKAGGRVILSGMPSTGADLSPVWFRELELAGTYASNREEPNGKPAFETALELAGRAPLDGIVGARYPLYRWREAIDHAHSAGRLGTVKVAFDVRAS